MKVPLINKSIILTLATASSLSGAPFLQLSETTQIHLLADLDFVFEDNIFRQSTGEFDEQYIVFSPGMELRFSEDGAASAVLRYQHDFTKYQDFDRLNNDYSNLSFNARYNSGVVLLTANASYNELYSDTIDATDTESLVERDQIRYGADLRYELSELTAIKVGAHFEEIDYELERFIGYETWTLPVNVFYKIRPKIDLMAGVQYRNTDLPVEKTGFPGYEDWFYYVGAVGELFSPVIYADLKVGFQDRSYEDLPYDDSSATYDLTLIYTGDVKTTVYAGLSRDYRSSAIGGNTYTYTSGSLGARYNFTESIGLDASVVVGKNDYDRDSRFPGFPANDREEDVLILRFGGSYHPNDYLTFTARYQMYDIDGNDTPGATDYQNNKITVTASLRY